MIMPMGMATSTNNGSTSTGNPMGETSTGAGSTGPQTTGEPSTGGDALDSTSTGDASSSSSDGRMLDSSSDGAESTGCVESESEKLLWAEDALLIPPMELRMAIYLPGKPQMARSFIVESGSVTFSFDLDCASTVHISGLVWDIADGAAPDNADSFYVSIDGAPELEWEYGCQTDGMGDMYWGWLPIEDAGPITCSSESVEFELEAGSHELTFRNWESGAGEDFAAIAAVVVSTDPGFDPNTLYDPST